MVIKFHVVEKQGNLDRVWNEHVNVYNFKIKWDNVPLVHHSKYPERTLRLCREVARNNYGGSGRSG